MLTTSQLIITTWPFPKLPGQSESVFQISLLSHWLNVLSFPVSNGGGEGPARSIKNTTSAAKSAELVVINNPLSWNLKVHMHEIL